MKNALILHGILGNSRENWFPWLRAELEQRGWNVLLSDLPNPNHPDRDEWLKTARKLVSDVNFSELVIVGHSLGVVTALDLIEAENKKVKSLISVSGFGKDYGVELNSYFLKKKKIDFNKVRNLVGKSVVTYGDNDPYVPQKTLKDLAENLGVEPIIIKKDGHINTNSGYKKFPLILKLLEEK